MAAEVRLGPETPLSEEMEVVPAASTQYPLAAASSGGEFLALWRTEAGSERSFHIARVGSAKPSVTFLGASSAVMAASGDGYLVVFARGSNIYAQHIGSDGHLLGEVRVVTSQIASPRVTQLVFNDFNFLLLASDKLLILDRDGAFVRELPPFSTSIVWAGVQNGEFVAIDAGYTLHRFSACGPRADIPVNISPQNDLWFAAASSNRILIGERQSVRLLDVDGRVVWKENETACTSSALPSANAWWDGSHFVSACVDAQGVLYATRYADNGALGGATLLSPTALRAPFFATNGFDQLLVWGDRHFSEDAAPRAFVRTLDRLLPPIQRRASVRH